MSKLGLLEQIFVKIEQGGMSPLYMGDALPEDRYLSPVLKARQ